MVKKNPQNSRTDHILPLTEAPLNTQLQVIGITAGHEAQGRLASMGILPGEVVIVVQRDNGGPLLIEVKGTRVALGRGISRKVAVRNGNKPLSG